ncbi:AAA family ATPase [Paenibacillus tarimensis]
MGMAEFSPNHALNGMIEDRIEPEVSHRLLQRVRSKIDSVLLGKQETVTLAMTTLLGGGHLLLEDVPGVGKTMLARAFAKVIGGEFARIQFTPDMQPSDVTGGMVWDAKRGDFIFRPGPIMCNVVLADEMNRTTPRTQSALLEAMEERSVSADGITRRLPEPFMLIATQNPLRDEGTYPLPEAQLDRFMMRLSIGYPAASDEIRMLAADNGPGPLELLRPVVLPEEWAALQLAARKVHVHESLFAYVVEAAAATRKAPELVLGASPRASRDWVRAAQAKAYIEGRGFVLPDDLKTTASAVLLHRLVLRPELEGSDGQADVLERILTRQPLPAQASGTGRRR